MKVRGAEKSSGCRKGGEGARPVLSFERLAPLDWFRIGSQLGLPDQTRLVRGSSVLNPWTVRDQFSQSLTSFLRNREEPDAGSVAADAAHNHSLRPNLCCSDPHGDVEARCEGYDIEHVYEAAGFADVTRRTPDRHARVLKPDLDGQLVKISRLMPPTFDTRAPIAVRCG